MNKDIKVFVSYRRADNPCFAERIRDWFTLTYKRENVFMDFDAIPPFVDFEEFIIQQIRKVDVVLAIIGKRWLDILQNRLLDDDTDYVRLELRSALQMNKLVAPILVDGASAPDPDVLPADIRAIMRANAPRLDGGRQFLDNIERVIDALPIALAQHQALIAAQPDEAERMIDPVTTMNFKPSVQVEVPVQEAEVGDMMMEDDMLLDDLEEAETELYGGLETLEVEPLDISELPLPQRSQPQPDPEPSREAAPPPPAPQEAPSRNRGNAAEPETEAPEVPEATPAAISKVIRIGYAPADLNHAEHLRDLLRTRLPDTIAVTLAASSEPMNANLILLLLTDNSRQDTTVRNHVSWAHNAEIPILPVLMEGDPETAAPYALSLNQMIDMRTTIDAQSLAETIRMYL